MNFLVDAHLPRSLCVLLAQHGHDAMHTFALPAQNETKDGVINRISFAEQRVVVSKDNDFSIPICCTKGRGSCCSCARETSAPVTCG